MVAELQARDLTDELIKYIGEGQPRPSLIGW